jgi:hypothetical protein
MSFDQLPEFTVGGVARSDMGNQGIPLESLQAPPAPPAGQAAPGEDVIGREVDALTSRVRPQPAAAPAEPDTLPQTPRAPAPPDALRGPVDNSELDLRAKIDTIHKKYGGSFERTAEALAHSDVARTKAQMERANDIAALRNEFREQTSRLEGLIIGQGRPAPSSPPRPGNGQGYGAVPGGPGNGAPAIDPALFQNDPATAVAMVVGPIVEESISRHNRAMVDALAQQRQMDRHEAWKAQQAADLVKLRPIMEEIYREDPQLYQPLYPEHREALLLKAAKDRARALQGEEFYREISESLGNGGTPGGSPAPPSTGALPGSAGNGARRPGPAPTGDWGKTRNMERLWGSATEVGEMRAVTDVLKERGFGETIPFE